MATEPCTIRPPFGGDLLYIILYTHGHSLMVSGIIRSSIADYGGALLLDPLDSSHELMRSTFYSDYTDTGRVSLLPVEYQVLARHNGQVLHCTSAK